MSESDTRDMPFDDDSTIGNAFGDVDAILNSSAEDLDQIGPYKILAKLGEGGFGVVYEAQQESPIKRRVALKIIKPGMDSRKVIARFEAERQALGMMTHPNISKVLGGGLTDRGLPYFVMELVRGEPITEFCDRNKLTLSDRLKLLIPVCHAVQHAHAKAVIHRDIKPSNILVGYDAEGHPSPTVIDFGVAKALNQQLTDKTLFTSEGQMIGTPEYMSPEQAEMSSVDIDTRTDVYSLGVVLYELLTGMLPFEPRELRSKMYAEMQRMIREQEPPRPSNRLTSALSQMADRGTATEAAKRRHLTESELPKRLRGELDWVVMKCLEKERDRRYATPNALAEELQHYLNNEPVLARPPSASYRLNKLVSRNKVPFGVSVGFVAVLIIATVVSLRLSVIAEIEGQRALSALNTAEQRLSQIQSLVRVYADYEEQIRRIEGATLARARLAESTMGILDELVSVMSSEPWVEYELASGYLSVGHISSVQREDFEKTINAFTQAVALFQNLRSSDATNQSYILGEAQASVGLASAMTGHSNRHEAMALALKGEQIAGFANVQDEENQLKERVIARSLLVQANLELLAQSYENAEALIGRVLASDIVSVGAVSRSIQSLELRADALRAQARIDREQGEIDQAIGIFESAIDLRRRGVDRNVNDAVLRRGLVGDLNSLGRILAYDAKSPERAAEIYRESLAHAEHLRAADPLDGKAYELVHEQRKSLATALRRSGLVEQSRVESELLLSAAEDYASKEPLNRLRQHRVLSVRFDQARAIDEIAKKLLRDPGTHDEGLGLLKQAAGIYAECSEFYRELIDNNPLGTYDKFRANAADIELQRAFAIEKIGSAQDSMDVRQSAAEHYLRAAHYYTMLEAETQLASDQIENFAIAYRNIGTLALSIPDGERAVKYLELADQTLKKETWSVLLRKAEAYRLAGDAETCRTLAARTLELSEGLSGPDQERVRERVQGVLDNLEQP